MADAPRTPLRAALTLAVVGAVGLGGLLGLRATAAERIAAQERAAAIATLASLLPADFTNDPDADRITVQAPAWLGSEDRMGVRRARRDGVLQALLLEVVAPDGYNGDIRLLIGVANGRVTGVRVVEHRETPGLGDYIDAARGPWIGQFEGRSLAHPTADAWRVTRDGGRFDAVAGATLSARAVVGAIRRTLQFVETHGAELGAAEPGATLGFRDAPPMLDASAAPDGGANP